MTSNPVNAPEPAQFADSVVIENVQLPKSSRPQDLASEFWDVWLEKGRVQQVVAAGRQSRSPDSAGVERRDGSGCWLLPGWLDLQVNDLEWVAQGLKDPATHAERAREVLRYQSARGVTGLVVATIAGPLEEILAYLSGLTQVRQSKEEPLRDVLLGALVEGSFMNPEFHGAHNPKYVLPPTTEVLDQLWATGALKMLNVAPEMGEEALEVIKAASERGVVVGVGHAKPHAHRLREAVEAGARYIIHLGNGPTGSNLKRFNDGGMLEEALRNDKLVVTVIVDGYHVHPQLVRDWLVRKEPSRFIAVSDAGFAMDLPQGEFEVSGIRGRVGGDGGYLEIVPDSKSTQANPHSSDRSNLFGAAVDMRRSFESFLNLLTQEMSGIYYRQHPAHPLADAIDIASRACSENPAQLVGLSDRGHLRPGARSDAVLVRMLGEPGSYELRIEKVWLGSES